MKLAESIESLRLALKQSMIENIEISRTLIKRMDVLNMGSMGDATLAQRRLSHVYSDITKTLGELDKSAAR
ncbi:hypothetical protein IVB18_38165 [Bradyrhizobium sp. 186]|uniref:hypothetical protein n=1 Tax=Bradyrhizobium sp. 186 TaxID=2782654 RepID=UPI0020016CE5|nr:hypothetical protein [Bradyrhizobium sp. 186]UPK33950.1 hypothetical protein IVB18_38165 [Bradyrhizobium sp. 186]